MEIMTPQVEDGTPSVSYDNVFKMSIMNGQPIAVTHIVTPQDEHVTKIFFFNGKSHPAFGLALGLPDNASEEREAKVISLTMVVQMIPGFAINLNPDLMTSLGVGKDVKKTFDKGMNCVYHFITPDKALLKCVRQSIGLYTFQESCDFIDEDKNDERFVVENG